jgi:hypothetical protein
MGNVFDRRGGLGINDCPTTYGAPGGVRASDVSSGQLLSCLLEIVSRMPKHRNARDAPWTSQR